MTVQAIDSSVDAQGAVPRAIGAGGEGAGARSDTAAGESADAERGNAPVGEGAAGDPRDRLEASARLQVRLLACLVVFVAVVALRYASPVLIPVTVALLLKILLTPMLRRLERVGFNSLVASAAIMTSLVLGLGLTAFTLSDPVVEWLDQVPRAIGRLRSAGGDVEGMFRRIEEAVEPPPAETPGPLLPNVDDSPPPLKVEVKVNVKEGPSLSSELLGETQGALLLVTLTTFLTFFFLALDGTLLRKVIELTPRLREKKNAVRLVRNIEEQVASYLNTVLLINVVLGVAVGVGLGLAGMPRPWMWGIMAGVANFIPYLGLVVGGTVLTGASLLQFDTVGAALIPPALYLLFNGIEAMGITPLILGRRFALSPVVVLISLMLCSWLWGIPGAVLAVPLLVTVKVAGDTVASLHPLGVLLSR